MSDEIRDVQQGDGWAVGSIDGMGSGPGFRKIRKELDVKEFGVNAIVMPAGYSSDFHRHERQEELYLVQQGTLEMEFGDGTRHRLGPGGMARVDAPTARRMHNVGDDDLVYVCVGAQGGYVGRDGLSGKE